MPRFEWPWALALLAAIPILAWIRRRAPRPGLLFNRTAFVPSTRRQRHAWFPWGLRALALAVLAVAIAQPEFGPQTERAVNHSIGIQILIDRSGSMSAADMDGQTPAAGPHRTRLDLVKDATRRFIFGDGSSLGGRPSDLIGLMEFASDAVTLSPLTLSHEQLRPLLESIGVARGRDDGTAIGDALAVAAARFQVGSRSLPELKSKVILLLTDGENNMGAHSPAEAAQLAKRWGVRIYALGIGGAADEGFFGASVIASLDLIAYATGGIARPGRDAKALRDFYSSIDRLEPTDVSVVLPRTRRDFVFAWIAGALALLSAAVVLDETVLRRIP